MLVNEDFLCCQDQPSIGGLPLPDALVRRVEIGPIGSVDPSGSGLLRRITRSEDRVRGLLVEFDGLGASLICSQPSAATGLIDNRLVCTWLQWNYDCPNLAMT